MPGVPAVRLSEAGAPRGDARARRTSPYSLPTLAVETKLRDLVRTAGPIRSQTPQRGVEAGIGIEVFRETRVAWVSFIMPHSALRHNGIPVAEMSRLPPCPDPSGGISAAANPAAFPFGHAEELIL